MDDQQRARELIADWHRNKGCSQQIIDDCLSGTITVPGFYMDLITAALRAAPEGWSFQRQDDGSIIVTAEGYGVVHVRPDDSDSIAAAMLHLLADDLAARPQGVKDGK